MILTEGVFLCVPSEQRFWDGSDASRWHADAVEHGDPSLYGPEPDAEAWRIGQGDRANSLGGLSTVEDLRYLPCWMREKFLPILMEGGTIFFLPCEGKKGPSGFGWSLREQKEPFWLRIVFFMFC